uniref:Tetraspanin n=1 Tax=Naja naja TaxID=35670 RepID=A0A8C6XKB6_NAJNA
LRLREKATMVNCCFKCLKCLFCFFNILLFLVGAAMFSLGLWVLITKSAYISILQSVFDSFQSLLYIFIAVGALAMFLGLWGCLGVYYFGVKFALIAYIPLLIVIIIFHFFPGLFVYFKQQKMEDKLNKNILILIQNYDPMDQANQHKRLTLDYVQARMSCCGWTGPENWKNNTFFQDKMGTYPCSFEHRPHKSVVSDWPVKKQGCDSRVQNWLKKVADAIFLVSFLMIAFEILGIGLSFYLYAGQNVYAEGHS